VQVPPRRAADAAALIAVDGLFGRAVFERTARLDLDEDDLSSAHAYQVDLVSPCTPVPRQDSIAGTTKQVRGEVPLDVVPARLDVGDDAGQREEMRLDAGQLVEGDVAGESHRLKASPTAGLADPLVEGRRVLVEQPRGDELLEKLRPEATLVAFGHVGDGNLHYNVSLPHDLTPDEYASDGKRITGAIYDLVAELGGSFSAEHGVGQLKRSYLAEYRSGPEYDLMRTLKKTLDPANILNPGKVM